ncbi:MAG: hypothetical protein R3C26_00835 [Calditrichia bacterium]
MGINPQSGKIIEARAAVAQIFQHTPSDAFRYFDTEQASAECWKHYCILQWINAQKTPATF